MDLYNLKSTADGWQVTKFDQDLNVLSSYPMLKVDGELICHCPQIARSTCRHRKMFSELALRVNTAWFLEFIAHKDQWAFRWHDPTGEGQVIEEQESLPLRHPLIAVKPNPLRRL